MKSFSKYLIALAVLVSFFAVFAIAETPPPTAKWFDMENCEMCKPLTEHPELMNNMSWEQHNITNGIISVTTVREPFMKQFKEAHMKMGACAAKMQQGEKVALCPSCVAFGKCIMDGARVEQVDTQHGSLMLVMGDTPELVSEIQGWALRTNEEMKKMEAMEKKMMGEKKEVGTEKAKEMKTEKKADKK